MIQYRKIYFIKFMDIAPCHIPFSSSNKFNFAYDTVYHANQKGKKHIKTKLDHVLKICQQQGQKVKKAAT